MTQPVGVPADGNLKVTWVPAMAAPGAPTVTELTAAGAVDLSCYLTADGFNPSTDEQVVPDDRICSRQTFEQPGRFTDSLEIAYVHNPKSVPDNKAYTTLARGTAGYLVTRWGTDFEDAYAATDIVDVHPATCGVQQKQPPEANSMLRVVQKLFITGAVQRDVAVVAAA